MLYKKNNLSFLVCVAMLCLLASCEKTPVTFGSEGVVGDPNITVLDTFTLDVSTLQLDSFSTKSSGSFIAGKHNDAALGIIEAKSFFEITPPTLDLRTCTNCSFDSITFDTRLSAGYMGDTSVPYTINIHEVTQAMDPNVTSIGYNTSSLAYNAIPLASKTMMVQPSRKDSVSVRLPDSFGQNLFRMMKANSDTLTNLDAFKQFFKGICLAGAASNNAIYYFDESPASTTIINLHYTIAGATPEPKVARFNISSTDQQFNSFGYNKTGTALTAFTPGRKQLVSSSLTNNTAYLHYNSGLFPKIKFGNLFSIKELHPYIQVLKAELIIVPTKNSFGRGTNYPLPALVEARLTDDGNYTTGAPLSYSNGTTLLNQYGSLYIDNLYGENTYYTYDVTSLVNTILSEGVFSARALLLYPYSANTDDQRLLINNSSFGSKAIKLKLSILGL